MVLAIASFIFVIYVKFFYNIDDTDKDIKKNNQVSETFNVKDLQIITQKIVNSNITKHYFEGKTVTSTNTENAITIKIDKNKIEKAREKNRDIIYKQPNVVSSGRGTTTLEDMISGKMVIKRVNSLVL